MSITKIIIYVVALFLVLSFAIDLARSNDWYELDCCDTKDCLPISGIRNGEPWSEIEDHGEYLIWRSSETGMVHKIDRGGDVDIRPSRDGFYHGCEVTGESIVDAFPRCVYEPVMF